MEDLFEASLHELFDLVRLGFRSQRIHLWMQLEL